MTKTKHFPQWGRPDPADRTRPTGPGWPTSLSMEVLMSSSLSSCRRTELMLNTILLWFWPSEDVPNRVHLCFPDLVKSHITNSPLDTHTEMYIQINHAYLQITGQYIVFFVSGMILNVTFILYWNQLNSVWTWSSWTRVVSVVPWASGHGARVSLWLRGRPQSLFSSHTAASESSHLQRAGDKRRHRGLHRVPSAVRFVFCGSELLFHRFYLDKKNAYFFPSLSSRSSTSGLCSQTQDSSPSHLQQELHCWLLDEKKKTHIIEIFYNTTVLRNIN